jgi:hypothetical protein
VVLWRGTLAHPAAARSEARPSCRESGVGGAGVYGPAAQKWVPTPIPDGIAAARLRRAIVRELSQQEPGAVWHTTRGPTGCECANRATCDSAD